MPCLSDFPGQKCLDQEIIYKLFKNGQNMSLLNLQLLIIVQ